MAQATAPILDSTICDIVLCRLDFRLRHLSGHVAETPKGPGLTHSGKCGFRGARSHPRPKLDGADQFGLAPQNLTTLAHFSIFRR